MVVAERLMARRGRIGIVERIATESVSAEARGAWIKLNRFGVTKADVLRFWAHKRRHTRSPIRNHGSAGRIPSSSRLADETTLESAADEPRSTRHFFENFLLTHTQMETWTHDKRTKSKSWIFTLNNYTPEDEANITELADSCTRITVGREIGKSGTPHLQGALTLQHSTTFGGIRKKLGGRAHVEPMNARNEAGFTYCRKEGNMLIDKTHGVGAGTRTDLLTAREAARQKLTDLEYVEAADPGPQAFRHKQALDKLYAGKKPLRNLEVIWIYGPTASGKTTYVYEKEEDLHVQEGLKWWDGYIGQKAVLIDDWRPNMCTFRHWLRLTDKFPMTLEVKGGTQDAKYERLYVTSPLEPSIAAQKMTLGDDEDIKQFLRRITAVLAFPLSTEVGVILQPDLPGDATDSGGLAPPCGPPALPPLYKDMCVDMEEDEVH